MEKVYVEVETGQVEVEMEVWPPARTEVETYQVEVELMTVKVEMENVEVEMEKVEMEMKPRP